MELNNGYIVNGRYEILEKIGIGGMANVYCAKDLKLDRKVTFKVLKEEFIDDDFIKRFSTEAQAVAKLSHPNIANVYDVGNQDDIHYIVMEYVDGYTLKELIKNKVPFSDEEAIGIAIQISEALENAHSNNIIHKDIKPQNILVTKDGVVKVTDFGIARTITSTTITTDTMGSVHYFSPEQARGGYVDNRSDIYSLGIVLYEMITGRLPFDGETTVELAMKHISSDIPDIKLFNDEASDSIINIIHKCTNKNTNDRYLSALELTKDLKKSLTDKTGNFINFNSKFNANNDTITINKDEIEEINRLNNSKNSNKFSKNVNNKKYKGDYDNYMKKKVTLYAILTSLIIMFVVSALTFYSLSNLNKVKVPDFVGKTWEQAVKIASQNEIYIQNTQEEYSSEYKAGVIMEQSVEPKTKVKKGETIDITLSLGSDMFTLPDFKGLDISEVYEQLSDYEVNLTEEYVYSSTIEIGKVIRQVPSAGTEISFNDTVTLYISRGEESTTVSVPNLAGMTVDNATVSLNSMGLYVGSITYSESFSIEEGLIISQSVKAGTEIEEGRSVSIVVSSGAPQTDIEDTELTEEDYQQDYEEENELDNINNIDDLEESSTNDFTNDSTNSQQSTTSSIKKETLVISPDIDETSDLVEVKVVQVNSSGETEIYINQHSYTDFPLSISVSGNEPTTFILYIDGIYQGEEYKSFE